MKKKRILAWLLTLAMVVTMFPAAAFADDAVPAAGELSIVAETVSEEPPVAEAASEDTAIIPEIVEEEAVEDVEVPAAAEEAYSEEQASDEIFAAEAENETVVLMNETENAAAENTIQLVPTNEELMFKVVNAFIDKSKEVPELVFALNGDGYEDVISGTYDEVIDTQIGASHDTWIHGTKADVNCDYWTDRAIANPPLQHFEEGVANKWQFRVPVSELPASGTIKIPVVVVSKKRYEEAEKADAENPDYSAAFTSRQFLVDLDNGTVRTGNLKETYSVKVNSEVKSFGVEESGEVYTVGTPKANEYTFQPTITMSDDTYDMAFLGTADEAAADGAETISIADDKSFTLGFFNTYGGKQHIVDGKAVAAFHISETAGYEEAGQWVERTIAFDSVDATLTISGDELNVPPLPFEYTGTTVQFIKENGDPFGMWTAMDGSTYELKDDKIEISIIPSNSKKTYSWMHWGGIHGKLTKDVTLADDGKIVLSLTKDYCGKAWPVAPIKTKDDKATTSSQYYLAVPAESCFTTAADYTEVDAEIARIPADVTIFTEDSVKAVTDAKDSVVTGLMQTEQDKVDKMAFLIAAAILSTLSCSVCIRPVTTESFASVVTGLMQTEQDKVDKMAAAIKKAIDSLAVKDIEYQGDNVQFIKGDGSTFLMWKPLEGTTIELSDDNIVIHYVQDKETYTGFNWGNIVASKYYDSENAPSAAVALNEDKSMDITVSKDACGSALAIAVVKKSFSKSSWTSSEQVYLAIPANEYIAEADYSAVDNALAQVPQNLLIYTDESLASLNAALDAVVRGKKQAEQAEVDAMAKAIEDAIAALELLPADYTAVDAAIAKIPADLSKYTTSTANKVNTAKAAVVRGKKVNEQKAVDAMAKAINDAVSGLKKKAAQTLNVTPSNQSVGYITLSKAAKTYSLVKVTGNKGTLSYAKASGSSNYAAVNAKTGKITMKKNTPAGKHTVNVTVKAAKTDDYNAASATVKVIVTVNKANQTLKVTSSNKSVGYITLSKAAKTYSLVKASGNKGTLSYAKASGSSKYATVNPRTGRITIKKNTPVGTYTVNVTVKAAKTDNYNAASKTVKVKVTVKQSAQTFKSVTPLEKTVKAGNSFTLKSKLSQGDSKEFTYKKTSGHNKITVSSSGKVTVKSGLKADTYKIKVKVTAKATKNFKAKSVTKTITIKVK